MVTRAKTPISRCISVSTTTPFTWMISWFDCTLIKIKVGDYFHPLSHGFLHFILGFLEEPWECQELP